MVINQLKILYHRLKLWGESVKHAFLATPIPSSSKDFVIYFCFLVSKNLVVTHRTTV